MCDEPREFYSYEGKDYETFVKVNVYIPVDIYQALIDDPFIVATDVVYGIKGLSPTHKEVVADLINRLIVEKLNKNNIERDE